MTRTFDYKLLGQNICPCSTTLKGRFDGAQQHVRWPPVAIELDQTTTKVKGKFGAKNQYRWHVSTHMWLKLWSMGLGHQLFLWSYWFWFWMQREKKTRLWVGFGWFRHTWVPTCLRLECFISKILSEISTASWWGFLLKVHKTTKLTLLIELWVLICQLEVTHENIILIAIKNKFQNVYGQFTCKSYKYWGSRLSLSF
jgi:hypothetical protein